jgi:hypothetical protein
MMPFTCHQRFIKVGKSERGMWNNNSWPCHKTSKIDFLEHDIMVTLCVVYPQFWARIQMMHSKFFTFTLVSWRPPFVFFTRWVNLTNLCMITHNSYFRFAMFFFFFWMTMVHNVDWVIVWLWSPFNYKVVVQAFSIHHPQPINLSKYINLVEIVVI